MAEVHGKKILTGFGAEPGDVDEWIIWGSNVDTRGRVHSFWADPFRRVYPWEVVFEVTSVKSEVAPDGHRRIFVKVANTTPITNEHTYGSYDLYWSWTDQF